MKVAVRYGDKVTVPRVKLGNGLVGYAALHKVAVNVPDVSTPTRATSRWSTTRGRSW